VDADARAHGRLEETPPGVQRDPAVGERDAEVAWLHARGTLDRERAAAPAECEVEVLHPVARERARLAADDVGDRALLDPHASRQRGRAGAARAAARLPAAPRALLRLRRGSEARDVQDALGVPDQRDGRSLEREVAELDAAREEPAELQRQPSRLELEEGCRVELRVLGELDRHPVLAALLPRLADVGAPPPDLLDAVRLARAPELVALALQARELLRREPVGHGGEIPARDRVLDVAERALGPLGERRRI